MNKETKYEFRKRIDEVHRPDVRSAAECRKDDETAIDEEWVIVSPETLTPGAAALDLQNYLQVSMGAFPAGPQRKRQENGCPGAFGGKRFLLECGSGTDRDPGQCAARRALA